MSQVPTCFQIHLTAELSPRPRRWRRLSKGTGDIMERKNDHKNSCFCLNGSYFITMDGRYLFKGNINMRISHESRQQVDSYPLWCSSLLGACPGHKESLKIGQAFRFTTLRLSPYGRQKVSPFLCWHCTQDPTQLPAQGGEVNFRTPNIPESVVSCCKNETPQLLISNRVFTT